jgi:hypothetical protein
VRILTFGEGSNTVARASGRVDNIDLTRFKLVAYIQTDRLYVQPYEDMKSIWVQPDGSWWTPVDNRFKGRLVAWLVPISYNPPPTLVSGSSPPGSVASAATSLVNDADNDLLPDTWEPNLALGGSDDPDRDGASNLEEFRTGTSPLKPDNDSDGDGLPDTWERRFFGTLVYGASDDPDGDGLGNASELSLGTHPGRTAVDRDRDGLPDTWEFRWFGNLDRKAGDDADADGQSNMDAYEFGLSPIQALPSLSVKLLDARNVAISWPSAPAGFVLEVSSDLASSTGWSRVTTVPDRVGGQFTLNISLGRGSQFFRLRRP